MNWLEEFIEENIRDEVKLLRDNGFNTECSCHHEMYVQCQLIPDGEMKRLHDLLFNAGYRDFTIEAIIKVMDSHSFPTIRVVFDDKRKIER